MIYILGFEENTIPGQIEDNEGKVKKEVQFMTRGEIAAEELHNQDNSDQQNESTSSITSIPSKPAKRGICCCRLKPRKSSRKKRNSGNDEEEIVVGNFEEDNQREDLEKQNSESDKSTVEFHEVNVTDR